MSEENNVAVIEQQTEAQTDPLVAKAAQCIEDGGSVLLTFGGKRLFRLSKMATT